MLQFARIQAGVYQSFSHGTKINVNRDSANTWAIYVDGEFVDRVGTLRAGQIYANSLVGESSAGIAYAPASVPATPKAPRLPAIMHNSKGLYVFGLDEICALLADTMNDAQVSGECREHTTKRGKRGYFVDAVAAPAFWDACSEEIPGQPALCMGEGKKWEVKL